MLNHLGESTVRSNLEKLPKLQALITNLEESVFNNQIRKIDIYLLQAEANGFDLKIGKIQRVCGIKNWTSFHTEYIYKIKYN